MSLYNGFLLKLLKSYFWNFSSVVSVAIISINKWPTFDMLLQSVNKGNKSKLERKPCLHFELFIFPIDLLSKSPCTRRSFPCSRL